MEPSSPSKSAFLQDGFSLTRSNTPRDLKRNSTGDLDQSRSSLMIPNDRLQVLLADSIDEFVIKARKNSSPEKLAIQTIAQSILSPTSEEEPVIESEAPSEDSNEKSYNRQLIKRSVEEQSRRELEPQLTPPKLSRKASARLLKRPLNRKEADQQRLEINEQFRQIFNMHGHYHPETPEERTENLKKWATKYHTLRQIFTDSGLQKEIDVKVAGLARIALTKVYIEIADPSDENLDAMMLEFYTQTNYHHHDSNHVVKHFLEAYDRFPEELKPYLEKTIILNASVPLLAQYLFTRLEGKDKDETAAILDFFGSNLGCRTRSADAIEFLSLLIEKDIWRQKNQSDNSEFLHTLFRGDDHLSIKVLQAYERKKFPSVIDNLIADFRDMYETIVHPHKRLRKFFVRGKRANEKDEENFLTAFKNTIENFCTNNLKDELAQILKLFRQKLDGVLGNDHPGMASNIVSSIFVLRLVGNASAKKYAESIDPKNPTAIPEESKLSILFSKWLIKCLEYVFDEEPSQQAESAEMPEDKRAAKGKFTISKERFRRYMKEQTEL